MTREVARSDCQRQDKSKDTADKVTNWDEFFADLSGMPIGVERLNRYFTEETV